MLSSNTPIERQTHGSSSSSDSKHYRRSVDWRDSGVFIDTESDCSSKRSSLDVIDSRLQSDYDLMFSKDYDTKQSYFGNSRRAVEPCYSNLFVEHHSSEDKLYNTLSEDDYNDQSTDRFIIQDDDGDTILHLAVVGCSFDVINDLVVVYAQKGLLDIVNNMMHSALHVAVMVHRSDIVELLIKSGARYNLRDRKGNTCLHIACQQGNISTIKAILESEIVKRNQDICSLVNMRNFDGQTCLHLAASKRHQHVLNLLVNNYKTDINLADGKSGDTILHMAIKNYDVELVSFILRQLDGPCFSTNYAGQDPFNIFSFLEQIADEQSTLNLQKIKRLIIEKIDSCSQKEGRSCICIRGANTNEDELNDTETSEDDDA